MKLKSNIIVLLPDTRAVEIGRFGIGNLKIGMGVHTYSRLAGGENSCPGATSECEAICYAKRIAGPVRDVYARNMGDDVPEIPEDCRILRVHISGDFDSPAYIQNWIARLTERPDVTAWAYTRSWRVPSLLPYLEQLRALPNMQLFASMDASCAEMPPAGWRRAWIERSFDNSVKTGRPMEQRLTFFANGDDVRNQVVVDDNTPSYICPEETGHKKDCLSCGYCFEGKRNDVTFLEH